MNLCHSAFHKHKTHTHAQILASTQKRESSKTKSSIRIILWILNIFSIGKTSAEEEEEELWMYYEAMAHIHTYAYVQIPYSPEGTGRQTNKHTLWFN